MEILIPGDHLLYSRPGFWSKTIKIKTWSNFSHVEVYLGEGKSFSSREKIGTGIFGLAKDFVCILRPTDIIYMDIAVKWAEKVSGQSYDYLGLLRFFTLGKQSEDKQFCSEAVTRFDRMGNFDPFAKHYDADLVSPGMFYSSPKFIRYDI